MRRNPILLISGLVLCLMFAAEETVEAQGASTTMAEVVSAAAGTNMTADADIGEESEYGGPMAGGTRGLDAVQALTKSTVPRAFEPGSKNFRPRYIVPNPVGTTRPSTFQNRFHSWRLGYASDGFRGAYFK